MHKNTRAKADYLVHPSCSQRLLLTSVSFPPLWSAHHSGEFDTTLPKDAYLVQARHRRSSLSTVFAFDDSATRIVSENSGLSCVLYTPCDEVLIMENKPICMNAWKVSFVCLSFDVSVCPSGASVCLRVCVSVYKTNYMCV